MAKSLMADMIKRKNAKLAAEAKENKKLNGKQKDYLEKSQPKEASNTEPEIVKEPKTLNI